MSATPGRTRLLPVLLASVLFLPAPAAPARAEPAPPAAAAARVHAEGGVLGLRAGPGTDRAVLSWLADGAAVTPRCRLWGERLTGPLGASPYWVRVDGGVVSAAHLAWVPGRSALPERLPWCGGDGADPATARVGAGGEVLNVRSGPGTGHRRVGTVGDGRDLPVRCQAWGQAVAGSPVWLRIGADRYVAQAYVRWSPQRPRLPWCGQEPPRPAPPGAREFTAAAAGPARAAARATGVPASVLIAQAADASGWGRAAAGADHNLFRRDCADGPGAVALGCRDGLRAYRTPRDAYLDQARLLAARYPAAQAHAADPDRFLAELARAAGGPGAGGAASGADDHAERLSGLIHRYDLRRYDR